MKTTQQQQSTYDQLLAVYLPLIHRAANSIHAERCLGNSIEDLLMAGFQGFKDAFSQFPSVSDIDNEKAFSQQIYQSMLNQINGHQSPAFQN
ncbi:MAG: hypothetical protein ACYSUT_01810 [Planctomycetota bacterium]|jgi:DNA-directed RNA polymerase specialized sigma subunit